MLVFGAIQFKTSSDGGIEIIVDGQHQFLSSNDVRELGHWLYHNMCNNQRINPLAGGPMNGPGEIYPAEADFRPGAIIRGNL